MGTVVDLFGRKVEAETPTAHEEFGLARRGMNRAFIHWLKKQPPQAEVQAEIDATLGALRGLRDVYKTDDRR